MHVLPVQAMPAQAVRSTLFGNFLKQAYAVDLLVDRILYIPVPQTVHLPFIARRPFFMVTSSVSVISLFCLHFTQ